MYSEERIVTEAASNSLAASFESGPVVSAGAALVVPGRPDRLFRQAAELSLPPLTTRGATVAVTASNRSLLVRGLEEISSRHPQISKKERMARRKGKMLVKEKSLDELSFSRKWLTPSYYPDIILI